MITITYEFRDKTKCFVVRFEHGHIPQELWIEPDVFDEWMEGKYEIDTKNSIHLLYGTIEPVICNVTEQMLMSSNWNKIDKYWTPSKF